MDRDRDELIKNIKENMPDEEQLSKLDKLAEKYKDKSEEEIFVEIIRINKEMESELSPAKYNEIVEKIESIKPLLSSEQRQKLDIVLKAFKKD